jgi:hypothetical protein
MVPSVFAKQKTVLYHLLGVLLGCGPGTTLRPCGLRAWRSHAGSQGGSVSGEARQSEDGLARPRSPLRTAPFRSQASNSEPGYARLSRPCGSSLRVVLASAGDAIHRGRHSVSNMHSRSRGMRRPSFARSHPPSHQEGVGNAGCPMHPQPRVRKGGKKCTRVFTAEAPESPGIPARNGFNGLLRTLPGDRALLPPSSRGLRFCPARLSRTRIRRT